MGKTKKPGEYPQIAGRALRPPRIDLRNMAQLTQPLPALPPPDPAAHRVYRRLRDFILSGFFAQGERLRSNAQLAAEFKTSVKTVVAAVARLKAEGLVRVTRGRGAGVFVVDDVGAVLLKEDLEPFEGSHRHPEMSLAEQVRLAIEHKRPLIIWGPDAGINGFFKAAVVDASLQYADRDIVFVHGSVLLRTDRALIVA